MTLPRERGAEAFAGRIDDDQDAGPAGVRIAGAGDETVDSKASMQLVVEDGVHVVTRLEPFRFTPGHMKFVLFATIVVQRIEHFSASPGGNRLGNAKTHNSFLCGGVEKHDRDELAVDQPVAWDLIQVI